MFIGSGSLTWFLRPRLASPESTTEVEANHPLVKVQPHHPTGGADRADYGISTNWSAEEVALLPAGVRTVMCTCPVTPPGGVASRYTAEPGVNPLPLTSTCAYTGVRPAWGPIPVTTGGTDVTSDRYAGSSPVPASSEFGTSPGPGWSGRMWWFEMVMSTGGGGQM